MITDKTFDSLAFPVAKVRYKGPTEQRGAAWLATIRRDNERTYRHRQSYDDALPGGVQQAIHAARACHAKMQADIGESPQNVAIPGDLDADAYSFTFVPSYFFNGAEA